MGGESVGWGAENGEEGMARASEGGGSFPRRLPGQAFSCSLRHSQGEIWAAQDMLVPSKPRSSLPLVGRGGLCYPSHQAGPHCLGEWMQEQRSGLETEGCWSRVGSAEERGGTGVSVWEDRGGLDPGLT